MKRNMAYRAKSLKELLEIYAFENGRESKEDAGVTKQLVVSEVYARIKSTFDCLDGKDADIESIYRQLIGH